MKIKSKAHHYLRAGAPACLFALSYLILSSAWLPSLAQSSPAQASPAQVTQAQGIADQLSPAKSSPSKSPAVDKAAPVNATPDQGSEAAKDDAKPSEEPVAKVILAPGKALVVNTGFEDIVCTNDVTLARKQRENFADSPEASFIYAVALSRTCMVEDALKEVRRARKLAEKQGGPAYFDKMIKSYEDMLTYYPDDNQVRYHLAWAYYMKAYVLAKYSHQNTAYKEWLDNAKNPPNKDAVANKDAAANKDAVAKKDTETNKDAEESTGKSSGSVLSDMTHIQKTVSGASPQAIPQIQQYYKLALDKLDQVIARDPGDTWARIYRAHLALESSGKLDESIAQWEMAKQQNPNNPAPYFFLGEGFLKQGNLKECLRNVSKAIALRTDMNANQSTQAEPVATSSSGIQSKDKVDATMLPSGTKSESKEISKGGLK
ncbi:MAG: tetratricopeptide repeat protein [Candidatus Obscuribacter sp.]|jgi:tetratricopeptide (TPR) repeat protein|nr:tetratricopeptide repeat protein [Candidatus Obscuribacter sp.]